MTEILWHLDAPVLNPCCFFLKGDIQSQAAVRAIARQVCEQLIQSELKMCIFLLACSLFTYPTLSFLKEIITFSQECIK